MPTPRILNPCVVCFVYRVVTFGSSSILEVTSERLWECVCERGGGGGEWVRGRETCVGEWAESTMCNAKAAVAAAAASSGINSSSRRRTEPCYCCHLLSIAALLSSFHPPTHILLKNSAPLPERPLTSYCAPLLPPHLVQVKMGLEFLIYLVPDPTNHL